jgi:hypothetical protein
MAERADPTPVREVIDGAADAPSQDDPPAGRAAAPIPVKKLPLDAPVTPLGVQGNICHYLDELGQHQPLEPRDHNRKQIVKIFGRQQEWLYHFAPHLKSGEVDGFKSDVVADALMEACAHKGFWTPAERMRGPGAWLREDGRLVLHCGDRVLLCGDGRVRDEWREPGLIGEHVYYTSSGILRPWPTPVLGGIEGAAAEVLALFRLWKWRHPARDPRLMIGWLGAAMIAGAIDWRPVVWITGESGSGKSTLLTSLKSMLGGAILSVGDASPAGIWQRCRHSSLPVALDEQEAGEDDRRAQSMLRLIRNAASGSILLRGGADHSGVEFTLRSSFMASSVLPPPMSKADRSRIALLELLDLPKEETPPDIGPDRLRDFGRKLLRRLVDGWPRWNDTLAMYRAAFGRKGYSARGADVFGTMLAAADLLLEDEELHSDFADEMVSEVFIDDDMGFDQDLCLQHLLTSLLPPNGPNQRSVGHWIGDVCDGDDAGAIPAAQRDQLDYEKIENAKSARETLGTFGLKIASDDRDGRRYLFVANTHHALSRLFQGTPWAGPAGRTSGWARSLSRLPGAKPSAVTVRFDKAATGKATLIPIERVYKPEATRTAVPNANTTPDLNDD